jgi:hypothetical protein
VPVVQGRPVPRSVANLYAKTPKSVPAAKVAIAIKINVRIATL